ncbi:MAG TPA: DsbA family protein [Bryobacteraceae bacterium]|jgi:protein-disulfide isomerase|nr:DsbA family protein [Bryobacteraceae bacterium]
MLRSLLSAALVVMSLAVSGFAAKKPAPPDTPVPIDKKALETYLRHLYVMDKRVTVEVGDPAPSGLPGFRQVTVTASMNNARQEFQLLVSQDGTKIIQGTVYDATENPFKKDLDKLKTDGAPNFGTQGATVVIVAFSDFECPYCAKEAKTLRDNLLSTYPTQVHVYFKQFPLTSIHPWSKAAAIASRCVYRQNKDEFWKYHDWIFQNQMEIDPDNLKQKVLGWAQDEKTIDTLQLTSCMDSRATEAEVDKDIAEGHALNVDSTPTLFINGRRLNTAAEWPMLQAIIDYEIDYQRTTKNAGEDCGCSIRLDLPGAPQAPSPLSPVGSAKKK